MCVNTTLVSNNTFFNYDGGRIIHECIVPSSRKVINGSKEYDIDVREFLVTKKNEVVKKELNEGVAKFLKNYKKDERFGENNSIASEFFISREPGAFDFRVRIICEYLKTIVEFKKQRNPRTKGKKKIEKDPWLFPDEMLTSKKGDCEDISLLLASLLISSGISSYNVRVSLGSVKHNKSKGKPIVYNHMWVMYKSESGQWTLLEPLLYTKNSVEINNSPQKEKQADIVSAEYLPGFTFNNSHLWAHQGTESNNKFKDTLKLFRENWKRIDPGFAGAVHKDKVLDVALKPLKNSKPEKNLLYWLHYELKLRFFRYGLFFDVVDRVDYEEYDPFDHFDNGYIHESWVKILEKIKSAKEYKRNGKNDKFINNLQYIFHAIADFYSHSTYIHFKIKDYKNITLTPENILPIYLLREPCYDKYYNASYGKNSTLALNKPGVFNTNNFVLNRNLNGAIDFFKGKLISGRYGQRNDPNRGFIEKYMIGGPFASDSETFPSMEKLEKEADFNFRGALPHHDDIAIDHEKWDEDHKYYKDQKKYKLQFQLSVNTTIRHIQTILIREFGISDNSFEHKYFYRNKNKKLETGILKLNKNKRGVPC